MATSTFLGLTLTLGSPALTALRIAPLLGSTASLTHAYMEWLTNTSFLVPAPVDSRLSRLLRGVNTASEGLATGAPPPSDAELADAKQMVVPEWFTNFFNTGVVSVVALNSLTVVSACLNLVFSEGLGESKGFYQAGLGAAVAHYAFVPLVGRSVRALIGLAATRREGGDKAVDWVREWVGYHRIRMCTVDALALGCFSWGVVHAVSPKA
ncbi:hypothetical protein C7974DRAFT_7261 [Boeremia exigua]|uniref:uncharacterized protein n=1 Tax=Boeremia exigua TaxID=749465 RepID=UPI001E8EAFB5|nr:uncharacterized protein C7974DRAFT_7261 [Boeremia exigua]KAH6643832.1 hypothetical protein C7974DRAFT_7261 [Boeremia exigua]